MNIPPDLRYTQSHEWARKESSEIIVGITAHAQEELRDVVFTELPEPGRTVKQGEAVAVVESVKAAFDIYAPVDGTVSKINEALNTNPALINDSCYDSGWMFAVKPDSNTAWENLMDAEAYTKLLSSTA